MGQLEELANFVRIIDSGGISRAAEHMDVAKSAVSRRLAELEARLGVRLITRSTRSMTLTDAGKGLYERSLRILSDVSEAQDEASEAESSLRGNIRLAAPITFGLRHLSAAIVEFAARHPDVHFDVDFNDRRIDLIDEGVDLAIRIGDLADSSLVARRLTTIRHAVCASPNYFERYGVPAVPADLREHRGLRYTNRPQNRWAWRTPNGSKGTVKMPSTMQANNGDFLLQAAAAGGGIIISPTFIVYEAIRDRQLQAVLTDYEWSPLNAYAVYPENRHLPQRVKAFVDFLADHFGDPPYWDDILRDSER